MEQLAHHLVEGRLELAVAPILFRRRKGGQLPAGPQHVVGLLPERLLLAGTDDPRLHHGRAGPPAHEDRAADPEGALLHQLVGPEAHGQSRVVGQQAHPHAPADAAGDAPGDVLGSHFAQAGDGEVQAQVRGRIQAQAPGGGFSAQVRLEGRALALQGGPARGGRVHLPFRILQAGQLPAVVLETDGQG
ncbi:hypothetical protein [Geothrix fuzhouensis]|uniref:hypothetical protein n=1 Tax=Geothrix fuzhouensis TaxID=2966451 RepID=UPI002148109D|nr:hypothetical protein [Geothrix fuzhouensis]